MYKYLITKDVEFCKIPTNNRLIINTEGNLNNNSDGNGDSLCVKFANELHLNQFINKLKELKSGKNGSLFDHRTDQSSELFIESTDKSWLDCSLVLTEEEALTLSQMTDTKDGLLLYRATTDGFEASAFHAKCDYKENTITIIKTNRDYVFGGYSAAKWNSDNEVGKDTNAFLFSLRRAGISCNHKFMIKCVYEAIYGQSDNGPIFGHDIVIRDKSNLMIGSSTTLGEYYNCDSEQRGEYFLAGEHTFLTTEIEVYQIKS